MAGSFHVFCVINNIIGKDKFLFLNQEQIAHPSPLPLPTKRSIDSEPQHDKTNKMTMRLAKTQNSLGIRPVWSESSLRA